MTDDEIKEELKFRSKALKVLGWILLICAVILLLISFSLEDEMPSVFCGVLGFYLTVFSVPAFVFSLKYKKRYASYIEELKKLTAEQKAQEENEKYTQALKKFQEELKDSMLEMKKLSTEARAQKIRLIGKKYFGDDFSIDKVNKDLEELEGENKKKEFEAQKRKEKSKLSELTRFAEFIGIKKRLSMLQCDSEYINLKREYEDTQKKYDDAIKASVGGADLKKSGDWAINGGIANAIAGPAAGIISAQNTINQNNAIDKFNKETRDIADWLWQRLFVRLSEIGAKLSKYTEEIEKTKTKLVSTISDEEVFSSLKMTNKKIQKSETGALTVTVYVDVKEKIKVFGDVPTVVDGTLKAKIYQNETIVGEALLVLPKYGVDSKTKLEGMCLDLPKTNTPYEVKIEPYHLWYMER